MRKGLLIVMAFLCSVLAHAGGVSREAALEKARAFMKTKGLVMPRQMSMAASAPRRKSRPQEEACYYVFNADRGYVIVSGDDRTVPILGYSLMGSYDPDNIPANMRAWLQGYADQIEALDSLGVTAKYEAPDASGQPSQDGNVARPASQMSNNAIAPLLTSTWDQAIPYCLETPIQTIGSYQYYTYTGCVATAMAQVINYHKYPDATFAAMPSYTTRTVGINVPGIAAGSAIDWANMADDYSNYQNMSSASCQAVADLMHYCGVSVQMDYTAYSSGSGAYHNDIAPALKTYFGYDANLHTANRCDYTISQWNSLLLQELTNNRPVIYGAQSNGGGHEFVIDGYDGNELFHVNWGWSGSCDGYFAISVLNPHSTEGAGASSSSDGYSMDQQAVVGVQPPGMPSPVNPSPWANQMTIDNLHVEDGHMIVCDIWNYTETESVFYFGFFSMDASNSLKLLGYFETESLPPNYGYRGMTLDLTKCNLSPGTYKIYAIGVKNSIQDILNGSISWNTERYVLVTIGDDGDIAVEQHPVINLEATSFVLPENPQVSVEQTIKATVVNNGEEYNGKLYVFASSASDESPVLVQKVGAAIPEGGSCEMEIYFTPGEETDYDIMVSTDEACSNIIGRCVLTVGEGKKDPVVDLEVVSISPYNDPVVNEEFRFSATIRNNGDDYSGPLCLFHASETKVELESTVWIGMGYNQVNIAAGETLDVDFWFTPDEAGTYYFWLATSHEDLDHLISQHVIDVAAPQPGILGDINGDGRVNVTDITLLSKYISDSDPTGVRTENADINGDGRITVADVVELARMITNE